MCHIEFSPRCFDAFLIDIIAHSTFCKRSDHHLVHAGPTPAIVHLCASPDFIQLAGLSRGLFVTFVVPLELQHLHMHRQLNLRPPRLS